MDAATDRERPRTLLQERALRADDQHALRDRGRPRPSQEPAHQRRVERCGSSLKYERLYRHDIRDGLELQDHPDTFREEFNEHCPHEALGWERPGPVYRGSLK